jgi:hypothetical protein
MRRTPGRQSLATKRIAMVIRLANVENVRPAVPRHECSAKLAARMACERAFAVAA